MIILHCLKESTWEKAKDNVYYGRESIEAFGYIHCSSIENFWRVAPNFKDVLEPVVLLFIDTNKVEAEIKWEDDGNYGRTYPHIYGELNLNALVKVTPLLKDYQGEFIYNFDEI
ncbi:DUF952 domain-containing protein [Ureibacillus chungkukjangi]|uniref:Uncharacterized protein (DUF952 family) n=1 Tax=Ureibacillus chungkukjangi TaxID=1202712 RepID=A0A318TU25_9BACL|nr:DUF952 domain-containing protein [Ureibacillus chungkukjangi]PYF08371.1 uncharacterized protein (DUF952 family) [Ureibacillus chungkukjangi]